MRSVLLAPVIVWPNRAGSPVGHGDDATTGVADCRDQGAAMCPPWVRPPPAILHRGEAIGELRQAGQRRSDPEVLADVVAAHGDHMVGYHGGVDADRHSGGLSRRETRRLSGASARQATYLLPFVFLRP